MDLKEFIQTTVTQIVEGVVAADQRSEVTQPRNRAPSGIAETRSSRSSGLHVGRA
jgi:hypothetical protein